VKLVCQVYRSPRREGVYLYVDRARGLQDVPEELLHSFGEPAEVISLLLTPDRRLAQLESIEVLAAIHDRGYFLQLPPVTAAPDPGGAPE